MADQWKIYQDSRNRWCWYRTAENGRMLDASKTSFDTKEQCVDDARSSGMESDGDDI